MSDAPLYVRVLFLVVALSIVVAVIASVPLHRSAAIRHHVGLCPRCGWEVASPLTVQAGDGTIFKCCPHCGTIIGVASAASPALEGHEKAARNDPASPPSQAP